LKAARSAPHRASGTLRAGLREARALHSRERRFVGDTVYDCIRHAGLLQRLAGTSELDWWNLWIAWLAGQEVDWASAIAGLPEVEAVGVIASTSTRGAAALLASLGEATPRFIAASNRRAPTCIRLNPRAGNVDALVARLSKEGIHSEPSPIAGLRVVGRANLVGSRAYREGAFEIQDEGSQRLAELVDAEGVVVDFCAGAGGKSLAMAPHCDKLWAFDVRSSALVELRKRAKRAGLRHVTTRALERGGSVPADLKGLRADRVLVDAPCSGSGVWRRHPELRSRLDEPQDLAHTQRQILDRARRLVGEGGRLVYGTCSVLREENDAVIDGFVADTPGWERGPTLRLTPHEHGCDGFFGQVLQRV